MKDEEETSESAKRWGEERRARRREFQEDRELERLDRRGVKRAQFKRERFHVSFTPEAFAMMEARRGKLNYGRGMDRSEYLEYLVRAHNERGPDAKEFRKAWAEAHEEKPGE